MKGKRFPLLALLLTLAMTLCCVTAAAAETGSGSRATLDWGIREGSTTDIELILEDLHESHVIYAIQVDLYFSAEANCQVAGFTPTDSSVKYTVQEYSDEQEQRVSVYVCANSPLDPVLDEHRAIDLGDLKFQSDMTGVTPTRAHVTAGDENLKNVALLEKDLDIRTEVLPVSYTVRFMDSITEREISTRQVDAGNAIGTFPEPLTHSGYSFKGWALADGTAVSESTAVNQDLTIYANYGPGGSGSSGGGYNPTPGTQTTTNPDGSKTTTKTNADGSATVTTETKDGMVGTTELNRSGSLVSAKVTIPKAVSDRSETVTLPVVAKPAATKLSSAARIEITPEDKDAQFTVEIPVSKPDKGVVAVLVNSDGTETIVRDCIVSEDGVILNVQGNTTVKLVENAQSFNDLGAFSSWAGDAVDFVSARDLFKGMAENTFSPATNMSRGMLVTVLYRMAYEPESGVPNFSDTNMNAWYADAVAWATTNKVVNGYGDGTFGPDDDITREQMVTLLYRYAKDKGLNVSAQGTLNAFEDAGQVDGYAKDAMEWAVSIGLMKGMDDTHLAPLKNASRAEVATILMRFCENVLY